MKKRVFIALIGCILYASFICGEQVPDYTKALYFDHAGQGGFCMNLEGKTICSVPSRSECELGDIHEGAPFGHLYYKLWFQQANGKYALYNYKGILGQWDDLFPISNSQYYIDRDFYFAYKQNTKWGVLDKEGNIVISAKYDAIKYSKAYDPACQLIAKKGKYWGVINIHENIIIPFNNDSIIGSSANKKGYYSVKQNKWGLINDMGKRILSFEYDEPINVEKWEENEIVPIKKNGKFGGLNRNETITIPCMYNSLYLEGKYVEVASANHKELLNSYGKLIRKGFSEERLLDDNYGLFGMKESNGKSVIFLIDLRSGQQLQVYNDYEFPDYNCWARGNFFKLVKEEYPKEEKEYPNPSNGNNRSEDDELYTLLVDLLKSKRNIRGVVFSKITGKQVTPSYIDCHAIDQWGRYALCSDTRTEKDYIWDLESNKAINECPKKMRSNLAESFRDQDINIEDFTETYLHTTKRRDFSKFDVDNEIYEYKDYCTLLNHKGEVILPERPISKKVPYNAKVMGGTLFVVRWDGEELTKIYDKKGTLLYKGDFDHINYVWKDVNKRSMWLLLEHYTGSKYDDRNVQYGYCLYENNVITEVVSCKYRRGDADRYVCQYLAEQSIGIEGESKGINMKSDIDIKIPVTNLKNANTIVLIIANETYLSMPQVPYALNDGNIFKEYCTKTLGVPKDNILYLSNATLNGIRLELDALKRIVEARNEADYDSNIIVYYTGHGVPDINTRGAYLMPIDGSESNLSTGYKLDEFYQQLGHMPAKSITVFLDACFSGVNRNDEALAQNKGARLVAKSGMPVGNMVVFAASQGNQTAFVNDKEQHGLFTYYLLKKLQETKGDVTLDVLANYLKAEVKLKAAMLRKEQIPSIIASPQVQNQWQNWKLK